MTQLISEAVEKKGHLSEKLSSIVHFAIANVVRFIAGIA